MSELVVNTIITEMAEFCPNARVEFAMRGEPLMHPQAVNIVAKFRRQLPRTSLMLTTNGDTLRGRMQAQVERLFDAGLNLLLVDTYYPKERRDALRDEAFALKGIPVIDFFKDWASNGFSPYTRQHHKEKVLVLMDDLAVRDGEHSSRQVKTHAGSNPTKDHTTGFPMRRNCGRPFREMVIHADGNVPLCCDDWKQEFVVANVIQHSFQEIWTHPRFEAARARLMQKDRSFGPCAQCDAPMAPRTGLLPVYDQPTDEQIALTTHLIQVIR
jgi:radical SAM protein with 4Fe4S-binding SPASM domain